MAHPITTTDSTFAADVIGSDKPVLVDFWASWCSPCKMIAPLIEELAEDYDGRAVMAKLDVDANPGIAGQFGVMSIPTLILFKDGKAVDRVVGYQPKARLAALLNGVLQSV